MHLDIFKDKPSPNNGLTVFQEEIQNDHALFVVDCRHQLKMRKDPMPDEHAEGNLLCLQT